MDIKKLVFATNNKHKFHEIASQVTGSIELINLTSLGFHGDIPETSDTIEGNALQKARFIFDAFGFSCFADDTGLEVDALNGAPGVYSARYAGNNPTFEDNINRLLTELEGVQNRQARFRTVIALVDGQREDVFEGSINGFITSTPRGTLGFGYDPVFQPDGYGLTFAEMALEMKNKISHRALAFNKLLQHLSNNY